MTEYELIRAIATNFPRSKQQLNGLFECDAELIRIGGQIWGLSMDEFSPEEDFFTSDQPKILGANLAVATLSDLFAAGVEPRFFMHSLSVPKNVSPSFLESLTAGMKSTLGRADCFLCGGDLGTSETWRYCGFAMGPVSTATPITRKLADTSKTLWITGQLGDANLAVLNKTSTPAFELRLREAKLIRKYATGCIDTSGGLMDALWTLHRLNPHLQINLHVEKIPFAHELRECALPPGIPLEAALVGGAGEYELLFATPSDLSSSARTELESMDMTAIADLYINTPHDLLICRNNKAIRTMTTPPPCPREIGSLTEYVHAVASFATTLFRESP
ncbi:MAG: AIR synthase related protein [Kiritimatiellales bacterium]|nr:AIR synthase related protein [Kiritimatiellales bacterium]